MTRGAMLAGLLCAALTGAGAQGSDQSAAAAFERLKALEGTWIDPDGTFGPKGAVAATYRVTGGGTTVVESFPVGTKEEMVTVYHKDGNDLVLTHYCSAGNQPRMRAKTFDGKAISFEYDGGTNIDPKRTSHMHAATIEFLGPHEIRATWHNWANGTNDHTGVFRVVRKE